MSCDLSVTQHSCDVLTSSLSPPFPFSSRACSRAFLALVPVYSQDQSSHDAAKGRGEREGKKGEGREQGRRREEGRGVRGSRGKGKNKMRREARY